MADHASGRGGREGLSRRVGSGRATIAAIATAAGPGGIGIVRISGEQAAALARALTGLQLHPRKARAVRIRDATGATLDHGIALYFPAPRSYTGEDVVELHAHGSAPVLASILARCLELGARLARPGEFSERAFLEGKLDLVQAEAVADLIAAGSQAQARAALRALEGEFSQRVQRLQQQLIRFRVFVEAALDFPEDEIDFLGDERRAGELAALRHELAALRAAACRGQRLRDGLHVVIVGAPNAGKSSLLNALAGSERAIVTPIPGTTRDLLREAVLVEGCELTLVDTAGLRASDDPIEREGVRRARAELAHADLILELRDGSTSQPPDSEFEQPLFEQPRIVVHSKCDLGPEPARLEWHPRGASRECHIWLSALTGAGLDLLRAALAQEARGGEGTTGTFSARARHVAALDRCGQHLDSAVQPLAETKAGELLAEDLRQAQLALDEITGVHTSDDLLGEIFSSFCIGK